MLQMMLFFFNMMELSKNNCPICKWEEATVQLQRSKDKTRLEKRQKLVKNFCSKDKDNNNGYVQWNSPTF